MKKLRELIAILAILAVGVGLTGCSDGDDDDEGTPPPANTGPVNTTPTDTNPTQTTAPASLEGRRYSLVENIPGEGLVTFIADFLPNQRVQSQEAGQPVDGGTYTYTRTSDTMATLSINHDDGAVSQYTLNFQAGTYSGTYTEQGQQPEQITGNFAQISGPVDTTPTNTDPVDTTPTNTDPVDTTPTNTDPVDTTPSSGLAGKRLQFQFSGDSGQELITFANTGSTFTSDISPGAGGTYTFTETATSITVNLQYDTPATFANDFLDATLTKGASGTAGTFTGNYFYENTAHDVSGNWTLQQ